MNSFPNYYNPNPSPVVEVTYEIPQNSYGKVLEVILNPVITIKYADGSKNVFDTNLIYERGYNNGVQKTEAKIKAKLGLS